MFKSLMYETIKLTINRNQLYGCVIINIWTFYFYVNNIYFQNDGVRARIRRENNVQYCWKFEFISWKCCRYRNMLMIAFDSLAYRLISTVLVTVETYFIMDFTFREFIDFTISEGVHQRTIEIITFAGYWVFLAEFILLVIHASQTYLKIWRFM